MKQYKEVSKKKKMKLGWVSWKLYLKFRKLGTKSVSFSPSSFPVSLCFSACGFLWPCGLSSALLSAPLPQFHLCTSNSPYFLVLWFPVTGSGVVCYGVADMRLIITYESLLIKVVLDLREIICLATSHSITLYAYKT